MAEATLPNGQILTVISLYGMFDEIYVTAAMHRVLSDLTSLLHNNWNKRLLVVGETRILVPNGMSDTSIKTPVTDYSLSDWKTSG